MSVLAIARRMALVAACAALVVLAYRLGWVDALKRPEDLAAWLRESGSLGVAAYVVVFVVLASAGVPAVAFMVPAPLLFPWPVALLVSFVGGMISSILGFWMARYVLRDWAERRIPPRLRRGEETTERAAFKSIVISRLILFIIPPVNWAYGLTRVSTRTYIAATFVGALPGFFFYTLLGGAFFAWLTERPAWVWVVFSAVVVAFLIWRRQRNARSEPV